MLYMYPQIFVYYDEIEICNSFDRLDEQFAYQFHKVIHKRLQDSIHSIYGNGMQATTIPWEPKLLFTVSGVTSIYVPYAWGEIYACIMHGRENHAYSMVEW